MKAQKNGNKFKGVKTAGGTRVDQPEEIAKAFNEYFGTVGKTLAASIQNKPHEMYSNRSSNSFALIETFPDEVSALISNLNPSKGNRLNDIPTKIVKLSNTVISFYLSEIINTCIRQGCYPDLLKIAQIIPIHKEGSKEDCSNFRPISLLCNFNRIFEKIIYCRLSKYLNKYKLLNFNQYGFRKGHCTSMAIYDILESKLRDRDKGKFSCAIYLDLSKAFDTVDINILLKKLEHYGIRGVALQLFKSYLTNRKHCTKIDGVLSDLLDIEMGVPQGSTLGPLLFLLYINDLPGASSLVTKLFADDTCLLFSADSISDLQIIANLEMYKIENWMASNKLTLNHKKSKFMIINKNNARSSMNIFINGYQIEKVNTIKYLGLNIDDKLSWSHQVKYLETQLSQASGIISKLRHYVNFDCLKSYYYAKVFSYLQYAILAWGSSSQAKLHRINIIHNNIVRLMGLKNFPEGIRISNATIYKTFNILQLKDIYNLELAKFMHKVHHKSLPKSLNNMFVRIESIHRYPTSSSRNREFFQHTTKTAAYRNWITTAGITIWGNIKQDLKNENYKQFSQKYRKFIIDSY